MSNIIDFDNFIYYFTSPNLAPINCSRYSGPTHIYKDMKNGNETLEKIEKDQKQFKSNLSEITTGNPSYRKKDQSKTMKNVKNLYNSREKVIKLYNDYATGI